MKNNLHAFVVSAVLATAPASLVLAQDIVVERPGSTGGAMIRNDDTYVHMDDASIDFGGQGSSAMLAVEDGPGTFETAGFVATGYNAIIWSSGDTATVSSEPPAALLYLLDEDFWEGDGDPFDDGALIAYINDAGVWVDNTDPGPGAAAQTSNVVRLTGAIAKLQDVNAYSYEFAPNAEEQAKSASPQRATGVLAHELQQVLPEAVSSNANGDMWVNYSQITPLLIEAIKEQQALIDELEERLDRREGR